MHKRVGELFEQLRSKFGELSHKISSHKLDTKSISNSLEDFKLILIEGGVAYDVVEKLCSSIQDKLEEYEISRLEDKSELISKVFKDSFREILFKSADFDLLQSAAKKKAKGLPLVIVFMGVNGVGKTTSIAKIAYLLQRHDYSAVIACSDTFRSGAVEQLVEHGRRLGIKVIQHSYGSDAAAVAFDAINYAKAHRIDVVLVDTAGRMHTDKNLIDEMKKVIRIAQPDLKVLVLDALTGNDAVEQCQIFDEHMGIDAVFLTKLDADEKGGVTFSVSAVLGKPILFIGIGQDYKDLETFDPEFFVRNIIGGDN
jgi:fused signal recognition particle receptor